MDSVANSKTIGNKGNNFPFQFRNLQLLGQIQAAVVGLTPPGGLATEATLQNVLVALQSGQDFEQNLVMDTGGAGCPGNCPTYLMVRIYNTVTHTFDPPTYYNASGALVVPVGPVELVNPQFVLSNILAQVSAINADLDVALSTRASELTLLATNALLTSIQGDTGNLDVALSTRASEASMVSNFATVIAALGTLSTEGTLSLVLGAITAGNANQATSAGQTTTNARLTSILAQLDVALSTRASEATLVSLNNKFTSVVRTPTMLRVTGAGAAAVPVGARRASIYNGGTADATVLGATLKQGEGVSFVADGEDDTLSAISYDALTSELLITYTT